MTTIEKAERLLEERRNGKYNEEYYVSSDIHYKLNSAVVQTLDQYEDKIDLLVDKIDTLASAYELVNRYNGSLKRKIDELQEENKNLSKRLKGFTRISVPRRR